MVKMIYNLFLRISKGMLKYLAKKERFWCSLNLNLMVWRDFGENKAGANEEVKADVSWPLSL